jgi:hypothetical protein
MSEQFEREKLQLERENLQAEQVRADRDHAQRVSEFQAEQIRADRDHAQWVSEQSFREAESRRSRWNPLALAVLAGALAVVGNAWVADRNGVVQLQIASQNYTRQQSLEGQKAEYALMLEIMKINDLCNAARNLRTAFEAGLLSDPNKGEAVKVWVTKNVDGKSGCASTPTASTVPPNPAPSPPSPSVAPPIIEPFETGWMGGGNTQPEQCAIGRGVIAQKHPGKTIQLVKSWEESKKDFFGHVEYRYFCTFQVE